MRKPIVFERRTNSGNWELKSREGHTDRLIDEAELLVKRLKPELDTAYTHYRQLSLRRRFCGFSPDLFGPVVVYGPTRTIENESLFREALRVKLAGQTKQDLLRLGIELTVNRAEEEALQREEEMARMERILYDCATAGKIVGNRPRTTNDLPSVALAKCALTITHNSAQHGVLDLEEFLHFRRLVKKIAVDTETATPLTLDAVQNVLMLN